MSKREYDVYHQQRRLDHQEYVASTMAVCSSNQRGSIVEHVGLSIKNEDLIIRHEGLTITKLLYQYRYIKLLPSSISGRFNHQTCSEMLSG